MKITFISDTHTQHKKIELPGGDILIFSGDFMGSGYRVYEAQSFLKWFSEQPYKYKIFIAGNHDRYCENNPELFETLVDDYVDQNVIYLKDDMIEVEGKVIDVLPGGKFKVELENKHTVEAHVSGKIRMNNIRILPGDTVVMELSPADITHGRITWNKR